MYPSARTVMQEEKVGDERDPAPGTPTWVDLASPDLVVSARFYGGLFGWDTATTGPADLTGGYLLFQLDGKNVAGLGRMTDDETPTWTTYVAVADADEAEVAVVANGGITLRAPADVLDAGRSAVFVDPPGAVFGVWQSGKRRGAEVDGLPGTMCWHQLASRNVAAAKRFYGKVFGWAGTTQPYETSSYTMFQHGGRDVAGLVEMDRSWPRGLPPHWMTSFAVDDCDKAVAQAVELGGEVSVEPFDLPDVGRTAVLGDPHGAVFSVLTPVPTSRESEGSSPRLSGWTAWPSSTSSTSSTSTNGDHTGAKADTGPDADAAPDADGVDTTDRVEIADSADAAGEPADDAVAAPSRIR